MEGEKEVEKQGEVGCKKETSARRCAEEHLLGGVLKDGDVRMNVRMIHLLSTNLRKMQDFPTDESPITVGESVWV